MATLKKAFVVAATLMLTAIGPAATGGYYLHKRGINQVGTFVYSGSYAYCR